MEKTEKKFGIGDVIRHIDSSATVTISSKWDLDYIDHRKDEYLIVCKKEDRKDGFYK